MSNDKLIRELSTSTLVAECPRCSGEFQLKDTLLFDGLGPFPAEALEKQKELQDRLEAREKQLGKKADMADAGAELRAISVGLGKILEKVVPAHRDFNLPLGDLRPLYEPIDLIAFNGLSSGSVDSITFYEIKTGKARLNKHEKMIKDAVEDGRVEYRVMK